MALDSPNDRTLINVIAHYSREVMGPPLTDRQIARIAEAVKRLVFDEIHTQKTEVSPERPRQTPGRSTD